MFFIQPNTFNKKHNINMLQSIPPFLLNAIYTVLIISVISGIIGSYIVSRRMVFLSGGITHASFGGLGVAWYLGWNPFIGAAIFAVLSALGIEWMSVRAKVRQDTSIGILWSVGMAIGVLFIFLTPGYAPNLQSYLFGNVLIVTNSEMKIGLYLLIAVVLFFVIFYRAILFSAFDKEFTSLRGVPAGFINTIAMIFVALAIVVAIKAVGIILVMAMFTLPQAVSSLFTKKMGSMMIWSTLITLVGSLLGLNFSFTLNIPTGVSIVFSLAMFWIVAKIISLIVLGIQKAEIQRRNKSLISKN